MIATAKKIPAYIKPKNKREDIIPEQHPRPKKKMPFPAGIGPDILLYAIKIRLCASILKAG
jgi:hypothetical protein